MRFVVHFSFFIYYHHSKFPFDAVSQASVQKKFVFSLTSINCVHLTWYALLHIKHSIILWPPSDCWGRLNFWAQVAHLRSALACCALRRTRNSTELGRRSSFFDLLCSSKRLVGRPSKVLLHRFLSTATNETWLSDGRRTTTRWKMDVRYRESKKTA